MNGERGFTLVEVIIAIVVLTVGLLGLVTTAALVTRMIGRGQRSAVAATYAAQRMEQLRITGCADPKDGTEDFFRGSVRVARNSWRFTPRFTERGDSVWSVTMTTQYMTANDRWRTDLTETQISCIR